MMTIDPGIRGCGFAFFLDGILANACYVENPERCDSTAFGAREMGWAVSKFCYGNYFIPELIVLEWPQTYGGRSSKGSTDDLLPLCAVDASIATAFPNARVLTVQPREWKGGVSKPKKAADPYAITTKVMNRLSDEEKKRVQWPKSKKLTWDVADAIGIGLYSSGRFDRIRVFSGT